VICRRRCFSMLRCCRFSIGRILPLMSLLGVHAVPVVNAVTRSLKSTTRSRPVRMRTIKIGFDPAADSIRIRSTKIGFDPNSVLESVRTLLFSVHRMLDPETQLPPKRGTAVPHFSAHVCCGKTAGWIKMPLGTEVGLSPGNIVLDGDPASPPPQMGGPPQKRGHSSPLLFFQFYCGQADGWLKMPLGTDIGLGLAHIVLDGDSAPPKRGTATPSQFLAHVCCGQTWVNVSFGTTGSPG